MGVRNFWLNYKNHNGTYKIDGIPVQEDQYVGVWNKDHIGKELSMLIASLSLNLFNNHTN